MRRPGRVAALLVVLAGVAAMPACGSAEKCENVAGITVCGPPTTPISADHFADYYANLAVTPADDTTHPYITGEFVVVIVSLGGPGGNSTASFDTGITSLMEKDGKGQLAAKISSQQVDDPDQVGTVISINCTNTEVGYYNLGGKAYETTCTATVVDRAKGLVVGTTFDTTQPPGESACVVGSPCPDRYGTIDDDYFAKFIESLPVHS